MNKEKLKPEQVIAAIQGSGGVVSVIARRCGVEWQTIKSMLARHASVKAAWEAERESMLDLAESVVFQNVRLAQRAQQPTKDPATGEDVYPLPVDTSDAKWMLSKRGKHRGYGDKVEVEQGGEVTIRVVYETGNSPAPDATSEAG